MIESGVFYRCDRLSKIDVQEKCHAHAYFSKLETCIASPVKLYKHPFGSSRLRVSSFRPGYNRFCSYTHTLNYLKMINVPSLICQIFRT
jgi:hypothetical protein